MNAQQHKPGAPVVGFNHNLNYKGKTFHVQTEDSGPQRGHIITHVFLGGNILTSTKSSYADILPALDPGDVFAAVRKLMEDQHKAMMKALLGGQHDAEIARRAGSVAYEPGVLAGGLKAPGLLVGGDQKEEKTPPPAARPPLAAPATPAKPFAPPPMATPAKPFAPPPMATPARPFVPPAAARPPAPAIEKPAPVAPPASRPPPPLARPVAPAPRPAVRGTPLVPGTPVRAEPARSEPAVFGDGIVSEKSLDEVILSYLAADLEATKR